VERARLFGAIPGPNTATHPDQTLGGSPRTDSRMAPKRRLHPVCLFFHSVTNLDDKMGIPFLHGCLSYQVDFKERTRNQANRKIQAFLQLRYVGLLTGWGYGTICWILYKVYHGQESIPKFRPRFRILMGHALVCVELSQEHLMLRILEVFQ